jgi:hypothetical protein
MADAPGRVHSLTLTLTKAGKFGYLDVADTSLGMRGNLIVRPSHKNADGHRVHAATLGMALQQPYGAQDNMGKCREVQDS